MGMDAVFENSFCSTFDQVVSFMGIRLCDYAHQDFVIPALKADDITRAFKEGKAAVIQTIE